MKEIKLDQKQAQRFTDALDNPPEPSEKLREAFMDYYETNGGILGCLPGETPASIVFLQQEERHRATLAARDAEIERLKARISTLEGAMKADEGRLVEAARLGGVGYFGCDTPEVMADTIGELREQLRLSTALVEKRERQLVWIVQKYASGGGFTHPPKQHWFKLPHGDGSVMEYDGTDAGLLAAIDEATETKEKK